MVPNSNFVGPFSEIFHQSKIKAPLLLHCYGIFRLKISKDLMGSWAINFLDLVNPDKMSTIYEKSNPKTL